MPELVSWQGRKGLSLEESEGDPVSRHKEPVVAQPGRCLCRQAGRALPGLSLCSLFWNPWFKGRHLVLKRPVLACQLTGERRAGSAGSVILSGRRQWPPAGVTDRGQHSEPLPICCPLQPGQKERGHSQQPGWRGSWRRRRASSRWLREGAPDLNWKQVLVHKDYRPSLWDAHAP